jgi:hypothetical protein
VGRLRPLFDAAGAHWIELPILHPADPFLETAGEDIRRKMFVTEGRTGERLALRPDFTIPVCLEHLRNQAGAERYAYEGIVFRRHDSGSPERLETGCEDIGRADRARADAEMLALAIAGASAVASGSANVRIGDIGVFGALLKALGLPGRWRRRLRHSFGVPAALARNLERLSPPREQRDERLDPRSAPPRAASRTFWKRFWPSALRLRASVPEWVASRPRSPRASSISAPCPILTSPPTRSRYCAASSACNATSSRPRLCWSASPLNPG